MGVGGLPPIITQFDFKFPLIIQYGGSCTRKVKFLRKMAKSYHTRTVVDQGQIWEEGGRAPPDLPLLG